MLIMAACIRALYDQDEVNARLLEASWPDIWEEAYVRHCSPGGMLPGDMQRASKAIMP